METKLPLCQPEEEKIFEQCIDYIDKNNFKEFLEYIQEHSDILFKAKKIPCGIFTTLLHHAVSKIDRALFIKCILKLYPQCINYKVYIKEYYFLGEITAYEYLLYIINHFKFKLHQNQITIIESFLQHQSKLVDNYWEKEEVTLLKVVIEGEHEDFALKLLGSFQPIDVTKKFASDKTYLHLAVEKGMKNLALKLIELDIDVNAQTCQGEWPDKTALYISVEKNNEAMVELLLSKNANVNRCSNNYGKTPLHLALENKQESIALKLIASGADLTSTYGGDYFNYASHIAASKGLLKVLREIYFNNPDLLEKENFGSYTPLACAVSNDQYDAVIMLYAYRASFEVILSHDFSSSKFSKAEKNINLTQLALIKGAEKVLPFLLNISQHNQRELIKFAAEHANKDKKINLIKAILNTKNYNEILNPFEVCILLLGFPDCEDLVIEYLDKLNYVNKIDEQGDTLLHHAAKHGRFKVIDKLFEFEDIEVVFNNSNDLPSMLLPCLPNEQKNIIKLLIHEENKTYSKKSNARHYWLKSFDVNYHSRKYPNNSYKNIIVPGNDIHRELAANQIYLDNEYDPPQVTLQDSQVKSKEHTNYVTAALTFIVSAESYKPGKSELKRQAIHLFVKTTSDEESFSTFSDTGHISLVRNIQISWLASGNTNVADRINFYQQSKSITDKTAFWRDYYHSEQLLLLKLTQKEKVQKIVEEIVAKEILKDGYKLYGIVLDYHSTHYPCDRCKETNHGFQAQQKLQIPHGFLHELTMALKAKGVSFVSPKSGVRMISRVSTKKEYPISYENSSLNETTEININDSVNNTLLLRDNNKMQIEATPTNTHTPHSTFFVSGSEKPILKRKRQSATITEQKANSIKESDTSLQESPSKRQKLTNRN